ncbi:Protein of unknown function [Lactobacillus delbrueckii subsp. bulgaricus]|nr:Protein of unknown function [Lactobacillus delbrueckii subsp. bulgaricus]
MLALMLLTTPSFFQPRPS